VDKIVQEAVEVGGVFFGESDGSMTGMIPADDRYPAIFRNRPSIEEAAIAVLLTAFMQGRILTSRR